MKSLTISEIVRVSIALSDRVTYIQDNLDSEQKYNNNTNNIEYWKRELSIVKGLLETFEKHNIVQIR